MQKTTALFLALMGLSICSFGQKNYQPGSILRNNGDSVRGLIDYRNWPKNPKNILFKAPNAEPVEYGISDLAAFNVYGLDRYQKAVVTKDMRPVSMDANDLSLMTANSDLNVQDTVWLRVLVKGNRFSLFELVDFKPHFYLQQGQGKMEELQYKLIVDQDHMQSNTLNTYRDQLKRFVPIGSDKKLTKKIDRALYKEKDLKPLVQLLNDPTGESTAEETPQQKSTAFLVGAGISYNSMSFPVNYQGIDAVKTTQHLGYTATVGLDLFGGRNFQRWFSRIDLSYSMYDYKGSGERTENFIQMQKRYTYHTKSNTITPALMIGYRFLTTTKMNVYLGARMGFNISSYPENVYLQENLSTNESTTTNDFIDFKKTWMDFSPKLGLTYQNFDVSIMARLMGSSTNYSQWNVNYRTTTLLVAYRFQ